MTNDVPPLDALHASEQRLALALRTAKMVVYEWDLVTDHSTVNQRFREIFGLPDDAPLRGSAWLMEAVHPDSRATMDAAFARAFAPDSDGQFEFEFRVATPNGADRWVLTAGQASFAGDGVARRAVRVFGTGVDITERKNRERQQEFMLPLADALRPLADSAEIERTAMRLLGEALGVNRVFFATIDAGGETWSIRHDYANGVPSNAGRYPMSAFQWSRLAQWQAGRMSSVTDSEADPALSVADRAAYAAFNTRAVIGVPLVKGGRFAALLSVNHASPRAWTAAEFALTSEVAERTWAAIERARAEEALRASEARLRTVLEGIGEAFYVLDNDWHFAFASRSALSMWDKRADEIFGRPFLECFPQAANGEAYKAHQRVMRTGDPERLETVSPVLEYWIEIDLTIAPMGGLSVAFRDITNRKLAEATRRASEERQAFLLHFSDALRAEPNVEAVANRALVMLVEQLQLDRSYLTTYYVDENRADVNYQIGNDRVPPLPDHFVLSDYPEAFKTTFENTVVIEDDWERQGLSEAEQRNSEQLGMRAMVGATLRKENKPLWSLVAINAHPRRWTPGEIALVEDVAERTWAAMEQARAEAALRLSEEKYRMLFDAIDEGFCIFTLRYDDAGNAVDWLYTEANPAFEQQTGYINPVGKRISELQPDLERAWFARFADVARTGEPVRFVQYTAAMRMWYDVYALRVGAAGDHRVSLLFTDITERKRREADQELLFAISADLSQLADETEIIHSVGAKLAAHLKLTSYHYVDIDEARDEVTVRHAWNALDVPAVLGTYSLRALVSAEALRSWRMGVPAVINDIAMDIPAGTPESAVLQAGALAQKVAAYIVVPFSRDRRWKAYFSAANSEPRQWTPSEIELIQNVCSRMFPCIERVRAEQAVQRSESRFRTLADAVPQVIWTNLADGTANYFNQRWFSYSGLSLDESFGPGWQAIVHSDDAPASVERWSHALAAGTVFDTEYRLRRADGVYRWHLGRNVPLHDADACVIGWFGSATDIDDLKHAEHAVRQAAERLHIAIEAATMGTWDWHIPTDAVYWNEHYFRLFGMEPTTGPIHADAFFSRVHPDDRAWVTKQIRRAIHDAVIFDAEFRVVHDDGVVRWMRGYGQAVETIDGATTRMSGVMLDITDQKQAEVALQRANAELEARVAERTTALAATNEQLRQEIGERQQLEAQRTILLERIITAQEAERQRIAHELHDTLGQLLSALNLRLALAQALPGTLPAVRAELGQLQALTRRVDQEVDRLTMELRPPALEHLGIGAALQSYAAEWTMTSGVAADVLVTGLDGARLAPVIENTMYRVAQEALSNVLKYAQATAVSLIIERRENALQLIIEDDEVGFAPHPGAAPGTGGRHVGLIGMAERATLAGGTLTIESELGVGTTIYLHLPVRTSTP